MLKYKVISVTCLLILFFVCIIGVMGIIIKTDKQSDMLDYSTKIEIANQCALDGFLIEECSQINNFELHRREVFLESYIDLIK